MEVVRVEYFLWWAPEKLLYSEVCIIMNSWGSLEECCRVIFTRVRVSSHAPKLYPRLVTSRVFIPSTSFSCCSSLCFLRCVLHSALTLTVDLGWWQESLGLFPFKPLLSIAVLPFWSCYFLFSCHCCFHRCKSLMCWLWHQRIPTAYGKSN